MPPENPSSRPASAAPGRAPVPARPPGQAPAQRPPTPRAPSAGTPPAPAGTVKHSAPGAARPPTAAKPKPTMVTGTQLATAFDGQLERRRVSFGYRIGLAVVALLMVLLPLVYFGIIAGAIWLVWYHITHSVAMFYGFRGGRAIILLGV